MATVWALVLVEDEYPPEPSVTLHATREAAVQAMRDNLNEMDTEDEGEDSHYADGMTEAELWAEYRGTYEMRGSIEELELPA